MSSLSPALTLWKETRASGEAQDEPPSQEAQDREHAEQAQIGEQVEKQLSSPSNQSFFRGTCGAAKIWYNLADEKKKENSTFPRNVMYCITAMKNGKPNPNPFAASVRFVLVSVNN